MNPAYTVPAFVLATCLAGCAGSADCAAGFEPGDDGLCYQVADSTDDTDEEDEDTDVPAATWQDAMETAMGGDCTLLASGDGLDLANGCVDGACTDSTYEEANAAFDETGLCEPYEYFFGDYHLQGVDCAWSNGVSMSFEDEDGDGAADPGTEAGYIYIDLPYAGADDAGLGLDVEIACYLQELGMPEHVSVEDLGIAYGVTYLSYPEVSVDDSYLNKDGTWGADGLVDGLTLYGF